MIETLEMISFAKGVLIDLLLVIPKVLSFPVVILLIMIMFHEPLSKLLFTFSQYIATKATTFKDSYIPPKQPPVTQTEQIKKHQKDTTTHVHHSLAQAYAIKGSYDEAISQYNAAINADPENVSSYIGLGNSYYKKGMNAEAIKALEKAVEIKPYWADCRCNLGAAYSLASLHDKAVEEFIQAININPNYAAAHYGLGIAYISAGNLEKAADQIEILNELDSNFAKKLQNSINDNKARRQKKETSEG